MDNKPTYDKPLVEATMLNRIGILVLGFISMILVTGMLQSVLHSTMTDARSVVMISATVQCLLAFMLPAWLAARLCGRHPAGYLGLCRAVAPRQFAGTLLLLLLMTPAMNAVIGWNENVSLPTSMSGLEETMRNLENSAAATTSMILGDASVWGLVSGVLVIGCLTGFAEEMFFRAGLQRAMTAGGVNRHVAVWTAAFVFSFVHFQFFGFVPRLLLGATFGYLYLYTGSLWIPAFAHAFNNSLVVVAEWLAARGTSRIDIDTVGADLPWLSVTSLALTILLIVFFGRPLFRPAVPAGDAGAS